MNPTLAERLQGSNNFLEEQIGHLDRILCRIHNAPAAPITGANSSNSSTAAPQPPASLMVEAERFVQLNDQLNSRIDQLNNLN